MRAAYPSCERLEVEAHRAALARCLLGAANGQQRPRAEMPIPREASSATACRPSPPCRALARGRGRATPVTCALATYVGPAAGRGRAGAGRWLPLPATRARSAMWRGANGRRAGPRPPRPGRERVAKGDWVTTRGGSRAYLGAPRVPGRRRRWPAVAQRARTVRSGSRVVVVRARPSPPTN